MPDLIIPAAALIVAFIGLVLLIRGEFKRPGKGCGE